MSANSVLGDTGRYLNLDLRLAVSHHGSPTLPDVVRRAECKAIGGQSYPKFDLRLASRHLVPKRHADRHSVSQVHEQA